MINETKNTATVHSPFAHEVQNTLARLLTNENIQVHRSAQYTTAFCDIENRKIGLPIVMNAPREVYDLFIGHEASHALFSDMKSYNEFLSHPILKNQHSLYNILEDIRIEKLILSRYPGLIKDFFLGYKHLYESNFFGVESRTIELVNTMHIMDRLNLLSKLTKRLVSPSFTAEEQKLVDEAMAIMTHEQLITVAIKLMKYITKPEPKKEEPKFEPSKEKASKDEPSDEVDDGTPPQAQTGSDEPETEEVENTNTTSDESDESDDEESEKTDDEESDTQSLGPIESSETDEADESDETGESDEAGDDTDKDTEKTDGLDDNEMHGEEGKNTGDVTDGSGSDDQVEEMPPEEFISSTQQNFADNLAKGNEDFAKSVYATDCEFIAPSNELISQHVTHWKQLLAARDRDTYYMVNILPAKKHLADRYAKFTNGNKKLSAMIASEFEHKKAAFQYSRSTIARQGVINVNALHRYKTSDDIFKSIAQMANAKNHGMIFLVDFSGSMHSTIASVIEKTLILTDFCRLVKIPFSVYTFTSCHASSRPCIKNATSFIAADMAPEDNEFDMRQAHLCEVLSHEMSAREYDRAKSDLYVGLIATHADSISSFEIMGSTPSNEALLIVAYIFRSFIAKTGIAVPSLILLSDGDGCALSLSKANVYQNGQHIPTAYGKLGTKRVQFSYPTHVSQVNLRHQHTLLKYIKEEFGANTICFYISSGYRSLQNVMHRLNSFYYSVNSGAAKTHVSHAIDIAAVTSTLRKEKIAALEDIAGFDKYIFLIGSSSVADDSTFGDTTLAPDADLNRIASAFRSFGKDIKYRKLFCQEFVDTVCSQF